MITEDGNCDLASLGNKELSASIQRCQAKRASHHLVALGPGYGYVDAFTCKLPDWLQIYMKE